MIRRCRERLLIDIGPSRLDKRSELGHGDLISTNQEDWEVYPPLRSGSDQRSVSNANTSAEGSLPIRKGPPAISTKPKSAPSGRNQLSDRKLVGSSPGLRLRPLAPAV